LLSALLDEIYGKGT